MKAEILKTDIERAIGEALNCRVFIVETKEYPIGTSLEIFKRIGDREKESIYKRTVTIGNPYKRIILDFITHSFTKDDNSREID